MLPVRRWRSIEDRHNLIDEAIFPATPSYAETMSGLTGTMASFGLTMTSSPLSMSPNHETMAVFSNNGTCWLQELDSALPEGICGRCGSLIAGCGDIVTRVARTVRYINKTPSRKGADPGNLRKKLNKTQMLEFT